MLDTLEKLGDEPPTVNVARNDALYRGQKAHSLDRHGPDIPLHMIPGTKTIEGRIYNDTGWQRAENQSFRWTDHTTMNRAINDYVQRNWERIRNDLAEDGSHEDVYDAHHRIGEGFVNKGMYGAGPRQSQYATTSMFKVRIKLVPGSDPPEPFLLTAYPVGIP